MDVNIINWARDAKIDGLVQRKIPSPINTLCINLDLLILNSAFNVYGFSSKGQVTDQILLNIIDSTDGKELEAQFQNDIISSIVSICAEVSPIDSLVLSMSSLLPMQLVQKMRSKAYRQRRFVTNSFDPLNMLPGTDMMNKLDSRIQKFILVNHLKDLPPQVIYSGHKVPGDAWTKIYKEVNSIPGNNYAIYGQDSDSALMALVSPVKNIFLIRDVVMEPTNIDITIIMENFRLGVDKFMTGPNKKKLTTMDQKDQKDQKNHSLHDFIVLIQFICGNLPRSPCMGNGLQLDNRFNWLMERLAMVYREARSPLCDGKSVDIGGLVKFMSILIKQEQLFLETLAKIPIQNRFTLLVDAIELYKSNFYDEFRSSWYRKIFNPDSPSIGDSANNLKVILGIPLDQSILTPIEKQALPEDLYNCFDDYLKGIDWYYKYYNLYNFNPNWYYPYHYAPLLSDLYQSWSNATGQDLNYPYDINRNSLLSQLVMIIPSDILNESLKRVKTGATTKTVLPPEYQILISPGSPFFDIYPSKYLIDKENTNSNKEWVYLVLIVDADRINSLLDLIYEERPGRKGDDLKTFGLEKPRIYRLTECDIKQKESMIHLRNERNKFLVGKQENISHPVQRSGRGSRGSDRGGRGGSDRGRGGRGGSDRGRGGRGGSDRGRGGRGGRGRGGTIETRTASQAIEEYKRSKISMQYPEGQQVIPVNIAPINLKYLTPILTQDYPKSIFVATDKSKRLNNLPPSLLNMDYISLSWPDRKTLLFCIDFLCQLPKNQAYTVVIVGIKGGFLSYLAKLFQQHKYHIFNGDVKIASDNIKVYSRDISPSDYKELKSNNLALISDFALDNKAEEKLNLQFELVKSLEPVKSSLKFINFPNAGNLQYPEGQIHWNAWGQLALSETRLIITGNKTSVYNMSKYQEQCAYWNNQMRMADLRGVVMGLLGIDSDHKFNDLWSRYNIAVNSDCYIESYIISKYLLIYDQSQAKSIVTIASMIDAISQVVNPRVNAVDAFRAISK